MGADYRMTNEQLAKYPLPEVRVVRYKPSGKPVSTWRQRFVSWWLDRTYCRMGRKLDGIVGDKYGQ